MPTEQRHRRPESYVVNWRERQKCFHVETVEEMLLRNRRNFEQSVEVDFVPITFAASITEANEAAEKFDRYGAYPSCRLNTDPQVQGYSNVILYFSSSIRGGNPNSSLA